MSKTALANRAGISLGFLSRLEAGERQPSIDTLQALALGLEVPLEAISYPAPNVFAGIARAAEGAAA